MNFFEQFIKGELDAHLKLNRNFALAKEAIEEATKETESIRAYPFVLPETSWEASTAHEGFEFEAAMAILDVTENDLVRADFDAASLVASENAEIMGAGDTIQDGVIFYARSRPEVDLTGMYTIFRTAVV